MSDDPTRSGEQTIEPTVLSIGDTFYVEVEGETLAIEVGA